ncbi:MAG: C39 family peptidase [Candidatus Wildermuthbacteria bacterium]|nr:C39 family peptidase [Candidatus Wildermuthbacteria bacterium]
MWKLLVIFFAIVLIAQTGWWLHEEDDSNTQPDTIVEDYIQITPFPVMPVVPQQSVMLNNVPFTPQAPDGNWSNMMFEEGCEEASIVIAMHWVNHSSLSQAEAIKEIQDISIFEQEHYGDFYDRSAKDTVQLIKEYFGYEYVDFRSDIHVSDIIAELGKGNLVITPMNGQKLLNPFYTPPGPTEHMVVVIGYDSVTHEIITHDPGTRHGEQYRYPEDTFENALRDYSTGINQPITSFQKNMIVVRPE